MSLNVHNSSDPSTAAQRQRRRITIAGQFGAVFGIGCGAVFGLLTPILVGAAGLLLIYMPAPTWTGWAWFPSSLWPFAALGAIEWVIPGVLIGLFIGAVIRVRPNRPTDPS